VCRPINLVHCGPFPLFGSDGEASDRRDWTVMADKASQCGCGHPYVAHEHYRTGTECVMCEPNKCPKFRPRRWWQRGAAKRG
jgi:hypothetical protein